MSGPQEADPELGGKEPSPPANGRKSETQKPAQNDHQEKSDKKLQWGFRLSWAGNWILLAAKLYAFVASRSKSVLASLADSAGKFRDSFILLPLIGAVKQVLESPVLKLTCTRVTR